MGEVCFFLIFSKKRKSFAKPLAILKKCGIISVFVAQDAILDVKEHQIFEKRYMRMKDGIHPNYEVCKIRCACGEVVETKSTKGGDLRVDICSKCHPFFTGKQKFVDAGGRVDKFKKRLQASK